MIRFLIAAAVSALFLTSPVHAGGHLNSVPDNPDPNGHYLFYMHGAFLEQNPDGTPHPRTQVPYDWSGIVKSMAERGFYVFSEVRSGGTRPPQYARQIAEQVNKLLKAGIAPDRITVAGHSKGGAITLFASIMIGNADVNYINMAGCGASRRFAKQFNRFVRAKGSEVTGRLLSLYDFADEIAGSCAAIKDAGASVDFSEIVLRTGDGHGLFYSPRNDWLDKVEKFARKTG